MVFLKVQGQCLWREATTLGELCALVSQDKDLQFYDWSECRFYSSGKALKQHVEDVSLSPNSTLEAVWGLPGGKGGFGSMLRALGAHIEKTTNKDACRDLSGRRLRDINEDERLKDWISKQGDRDKEAADKKEAKLSKLRRIANGENKHEFNDPEFEAAREENSERVHDALLRALNITKVELLPTKASSSAPKRKLSEDGKKEEVSKKDDAKKMKKGLFIGVDLSDSDLESSSDEEEEDSA
uniref:C1orf55 homolog n=1 Tax=Caligus rogercresseyi TaxID=217165 RepID=C1BN14_CALRO|nr:C1orf55 homolog [Caligus rogercresseyi]